MTRSGGSDTRSAILQEARKVLVEQGYRSLSMRPLASSVGCTATSIYLYFKNKDALIHALIDEGMGMLHQHLTAALADAENAAGVNGSDNFVDAAERMRLLASAYFDFGLANPEYYEVMFMLHPKFMERYPAEMFRRARRNLELFSGQLHEGEGILPEDRHAQGVQVWSSLHGAVSLLIANRVDIRIPPEKLRELAIDQAVAVAAAHPQSN